MRLVWAPEAAIAFFGGDADNFEYPRYCLDVTLFRVYEDGKPAKIEHHLKWADKPRRRRRTGLRIGKPGPHSAAVHGRRVQVHARCAKSLCAELYSPQGSADAAVRSWCVRKSRNDRAQDDLFGLQNSRKAYIGNAGRTTESCHHGQKKQQTETQLLAAVRKESANPRTGNGMGRNLPTANRKRPAHWAPSHRSVRGCMTSRKRLC